MPDPVLIQAPQIDLRPYASLRDDSFSVRGKRNPPLRGDRIPADGQSLSASVEKRVLQQTGRLVNDHPVTRDRIKQVVVVPRQ